MKLVSYNIQYGKGQDEVVDIHRIVDEIQDADIIALQEVERFWPRSGMIDQVALISKRLPDHYFVYGPGVDLHNEQSTALENQRRQFGNMILSRFPIESSRHHLLPKRGSIGPLSLQRSAIEANILVEGKRIRFYSVHLTHLSAQTRLPQIQTLLNIHHRAQHEGHPVNGDLTGFDWEDGVKDQTVSPHAIIMGDFNCQPDSEEYTAMVGPISDYGGRITSTDGFIDAWTYVGNSPDSGATSTVDDEPARLDYCFISPDLRHAIIRCKVDNKAQGSDHFPVWVEIAPENIKEL